MSNVKEVEPRSGEIRQTLSDKPTFSMVSSEEFSEMPKDFDPELLDMRSKMLTKLKNRMSALDPPSNEESKEIQASKSEIAPRLSTRIDP